MIRFRKSTRKTAPVGVKTQTQCSGHESCNSGKCHHQKPWWHDSVISSFKFKKGKS